MEPVRQHGGGANAGGSGKKVEPGSMLAANNTTSSRKTLNWPIEYMQAHITGRFVCNGIFLLFTSQTVAPVITFQKYKVLPVSITNHCAVFCHLMSLLNALICYSNWTSWIVFHRLTSTLNNTPPPTQPLQLF